MLTVKILFTINSLEKKKKLFIQNTVESREVLLDPSL